MAKITLHHGVLGCAVVALALSIGALATHWYQFTVALEENPLVVKLEWSKLADSDGYTTTYDSDGLSHVKSNIHVCLTFLILGFVALVDFITTFALQTFRGSGTVNRLPVVVGALATLFTFVSFFALLGFPSSFTKDEQNGKCFVPGEPNPCTKLIASNAEEFFTISWAPGPGWWLAFVAALAMGLATGLSNKARVLVLERDSSVPLVKGPTLEIPQFCW